MSTSDKNDAEKYRFIRDHLFNDAAVGDDFSHVEAYRPVVRFGQFTGVEQVEKNEFDEFITFLLQQHKGK